MRFFRKIYFVIFLLFIIASCNKDKVDLNKITSNHYVAIPLVFAEIGILDILKDDTDSLVNTSADGAVSLVYGTEEINFSVDELGITLPNIEFNSAIPSPSIGGNPFNSGDSIIKDTSITQSFSIDLNGVTPELKFIDLNSGDLAIGFNNGLNHTVEVTMTFPSILNSFGNPYTVYRSIPPNALRDAGIPLIGYQLDLTKGDSICNCNELIIDVNLTIISSGQALSSSEQLDIDFSIRSMDFSKLEGDLKNYKQVLDPFEFTMDIFGNSDSAGTFSLTNPSIDFDFENNMGIGAYVGMDEMYYQEIKNDGSSGDTTHLSYDCAIQNIRTADTFYLPQIGFDANSTNNISSTISIDNTNSSIGDLINEVPKTLTAKPFIEINPDTSISNTNVIHKPGEITFDSEVLLPLEGYAGNWIIADTLPFDFQVDSITTDSTNINSAQIKFVTDNGWPLDVKFTLNLVGLDTNGNDSLLSSIANQEIILESGVLDQNGKVISPTAKTTVLDCDSDCVDDLNITKKVVISVEAETEGFDSQNPVKIYKPEDDGQGLYEIKLSMALLVAGKIY